MIDPKGVGNKRYVGFLPEMLETIAEKLNFQFTLYEVAVRKLQFHRFKVCRWSVLPCPNLIRWLPSGYNKFTIYGYRLITVTPGRMVTGAVRMTREDGPV